MSPTSNKKLFLSAVTSEFGSYRALLASDLKRPTLDVAVQTDFVTSGGSTLEKLDAYIKVCDGVVHLIGKAGGSVPEAVQVKALLARYPDFAERLEPLAEKLRQADPGFSYTQWEAYLAIYHRRALFIYRPEDFEEDGCRIPRESGFVTDPAQEQLQREHYARICALGRDRGQFPNQERLSSAVLRDLVEILPRLDARIDVPPTRLRHTAEVLIGRDAELTVLDDAWNDPSKNVVVVRGKGGEGKTSLVATWMAELAAKDWRGAEKVYDWSFYSQGTKDQGTASGEAFIVAALGFFGDPDPNQGAPEERGARLAQAVGRQRCLLVLDGLEPLQFPPGPMHGQVTDKGVAALLRGLAGRNAGLCVVTTREKVDEIKQHYGKAAIDHQLDVLSPDAGAALLHFAGAKWAGDQAIARDDAELKLASEEVSGHALTLFLMGQYLQLTEDGDIRRRDRMKLADAEAEYKNDATRPYGHAFKAIEAYESWFSDGDEQAQRQLAVLRILGLFDRPASRTCLDALRAEPPIAGLTDALAGGSERTWKIALGRLEEINLVDVRDDGSVDCHPLIREYFAMQLMTERSAAWRAAHERLYRHLCESALEGSEPSLEDLQPLYQAVAHGCWAGLHQDACDKVLFARLKRGNDNYAFKKLGAIGSELGALACFFDPPWSRVAATLTESDQSWLLATAAFNLRVLGRLTEAREPLRAAFERAVASQNWQNSAISASSLSEIELMLGDVDAAVDDGQLSVEYAQRFGELGQIVINLTTHADALFQAGQPDIARARFAEAEAMLGAGDPLLVSVQGSQYCDLMLAPAERAAWQLQSGVGPGDRAGLVALCDSVSRRATQTLASAENSPAASLLDIAVDYLTLARAALYRAILEESSLEECEVPVAKAVTALWRAGTQEFIARGLTTRAWFRRQIGAPLHLARADLIEASNIAERGSMRLLNADIHLYRARLFFCESPYPWDSPAADLAVAEKLIDECGYHRRDDELADAKKAILGI